MEHLYDVFCSSAQDVFPEMTGIQLQPQGQLYKDDNELCSLGVASILNFVGMYNGRFLIHIEPQVALQAAEFLFGTPFETVKDPVVLGVLSEINNTIAGHAITKINNMYSGDLRLVPPIVFAGSQVVIAIPRLSSVSMDYATEFGKVRINFAVKGGGSHA